LNIADVTEEFDDPTVTFNAFKSIIKQGGVVRAIPAPGAAAKPRSFFDKLNDWARQEMGAAGLGYIAYEHQMVSEDPSGKPVGPWKDRVIAKGPIAKFVPIQVQERIAAKLGIEPGGAIFFSAGKQNEAAKLAGAARTKLGWELDLVNTQGFEFCWITDFPFYEWNEEEKKIDFSHNPFSMPQGGIEALEAAKAKGDEALLELKAFQYDIVCNGVELSSGAIRNHLPEIMYKAFEIAGYGPEVVDSKFGGMIRALKFGAPPHGGIAPGVDRIVMLLCGTDNLRDVTMFPMNQRAEDLLMGAPSEVSPRQLQELHIRLSLPKK
jgi:aspartyl-tRNA synthetase